MGVTQQDGYLSNNGDARTIVDPKEFGEDPVDLLRQRIEDFLARHVSSEHLIRRMTVYN